MVSQIVMCSNHMQWWENLLIGTQSLFVCYFRDLPALSIWRLGALSTARWTESRLGTSTSSKRRTPSSFTSNRGFISILYRATCIVMHSNILGDADVSYYRELVIRRDWNSICCSRSVCETNLFAYAQCNWIFPRHVITWPLNARCIVVLDADSRI